MFQKINSKKKKRNAYKVKRLFQRYTHPLTFNTTMISFIKKKTKNNNLNFYLNQPDLNKIRI